MELIEEQAATDGVAPSRRLRRLQISFVLLALVTSILKNLDRATLSIAAIHIRHDLGITATQVGGLLSIWSLTYAVCNIPAGFFIDKLGVRKFASVAIFLWSLAQLTGGLVTGYWQMFVTRFFLGVTEAPNAPANAKAVATWVPVRNRGLAWAVYTSGSSVGPFLAPLILTGLMTQFGWRMMFVAMGVMGIILATIYYVFYRDVEHANLTDEEKDALAEGDTKASQAPVTFAHWKALYRFKTTWALMVGALTIGWVYWIYGGWMPLYLETEFHMTVGKTGLLASIPFLGGIFGSFLGGLWMDWLKRRGATRLQCCKTPIVVSCIGISLSTVGIAFSSYAPMALAFSFCAVCLVSMTTTALWNAGTVLYPKRLVGSAITAVNFASYVGATLSPLVTGYFVDVTGSFKTSFLIGAGAAALGSWLIYRKVNTVVSEAEIENVLSEASSRSSR